jgi:molecular chaperone GrpE
VMMKNNKHNLKENKQKFFNEATDNKENTQKQHNNNRIQDNPLTGDSKESELEDCICTGNTSDNNSCEVMAIEEKLAEMQDKYIRLSAEFDNYRRRTLREKIELSKYAGENLILKIIPLMDDFERALKHMDTVTDSIAVKNGIDLIYSKFSDFFKQNGIKEIESLNSNFNVNLHEAIAKVPVADEDKKGKVVDVVLKGYYLQDKVLRFSKVVVGE